jgi:hypothetical protein
MPTPRLMTVLPHPDDESLAPAAIQILGGFLNPGLNEYSWLGLSTIDPVTSVPSLNTSRSAGNEYCPLDAPSSSFHA